MFSKASSGHDYILRCGIKTSRDDTDLTSIEQQTFAYVAYIINTFYCTS